MFAYARTGRALLQINQRLTYQKVENISIYITYLSMVLNIVNVSNIHKTRVEWHLLKYLNSASRNKFVNHVYGVW